MSCPCENCRGLRSHISPVFPCQRDRECLKPQGHHGGCSMRAALPLLETIRPPLATYFPTPIEHRKRLMDAAIRALVQLQEGWRDCPQVWEEELAFAELALHRIRRETP